MPTELVFIPPPAQKSGEPAKTWMKGFTARPRGERTHSTVVG
jgi:hypothetical protein